jgi:hypothetical protein
MTDDDYLALGKRLPRSGLEELELCARARENPVGRRHAQFG